ncbi:MAG: hypothetical protein IJU80_02860 [Lachnospiraceae bacterium]|nr:hypothetical protein [Lachnospiraceae bacterium]
MAEKKKDTEWMQFETGHGKKPNQKLTSYPRKFSLFFLPSVCCRSEKADIFPTFPGF